MSFRRAFFKKAVKDPGSSSNKSEDDIASVDHDEIPAVFSMRRKSPVEDRDMTFSSFVKSGPMDKWKDFELEKIKAYNRKAKQFALSQPDYDKMPLSEKYNTKAAALYRDKISNEAAGKSWSLETSAAKNCRSSSTTKSSSSRSSLKSYNFSSSNSQHQNDDYWDNYNSSYQNIRSFPSSRKEKEEGEASYAGASERYVSTGPSEFEKDWKNWKIHMKHDSCYEKIRNLLKEMEDTEKPPKPTTKSSKKGVKNGKKNNNKQDHEMENEILKIRYENEARKIARDDGDKEVEIAKEKVKLAEVESKRKDTALKTVKAKVKAAEIQLHNENQELYGQEEINKINESIKRH